MIILPAIDIRGGKCVRLTQGDFERETVYSDDPQEVAQKWQNEGANFLHVVDLDGAKAGSPINIFTIKHILEVVKIPVEVGGGIRKMEDIENLLEMGVRRVILGSAAIENPELVREAAEEFGENIVVGIDAKDGKVAVHGWRDSSEMDSVELVEQIGDFGISRIIYTDISRDGMLSGINAEHFADLARKSGISVIASGGVGSLEDIRSLKVYEADGVAGVIIGKALYTGAISLKDAIAVAEGEENVD